LIDNVQASKHAGEIAGACRIDAGIGTAKRIPGD
jgi:hypothetical protein